MEDTWGTACSTHAVHHAIHTQYTRSTHAVHTQYTRSTHRKRTWRVDHAGRVYQHEVVAQTGGSVSCLPALPCSIAAVVAGSGAGVGCSSGAIAGLLAVRAILLSRLELPDLQLRLMHEHWSEVRQSRKPQVGIADKRGTGPVGVARAGDDDGKGIVGRGDP